MLCLTYPSYNCRLCNTHRSARAKGKRAEAREGGVECLSHRIILGWKSSWYSQGEVSLFEAPDCTILRRPQDSDEVVGELNVALDKFKVIMEAKDKELEDSRAQYTKLYEESMRVVSKGMLKIQSEYSANSRKGNRMPGTLLKLSKTMTTRHPKMTLLTNLLTFCLMSQPQQPSLLHIRWWSHRLMFIFSLFSLVTFIFFTFVTNLLSIPLILWVKLSFYFSHV